MLRKASWSKHPDAHEGKGGSMVAVGGADRALTVWDATTGEIRYKVSTIDRARLYRKTASCC